MVRIRTAPAYTRAIWAMLLGLVLTMRLVTPAGFMPAFDHGHMAIVDCPGTAPVAMPAMGGMDHHQAKANPDCPFGTVTGAGLADVHSPIDLGVAVASVPLQAGVVAAFLLPRGQHERPPAIGPPEIA